MNHRSTILVPVVAGFGIILLIMLALIAAGIGQVRTLGQQVSAIVEQQNRKEDLATQMRGLQRERHLALLNTAEMEDAFARDEAYMRFYHLAARFIQLRDDFLALPLDKDELAIWRDIRQDIATVEALSDSYFERLPGLTTRTAAEAEVERIAPAQIRMMSTWDRLISLQQDKNRLALAKAQSVEHKAHRLAYGMGGLALLVSLLMAVLVARITRRQENALRMEKGKAEVTLAAISDAVIRFDLEEHFCHLNPAARKLLGVEQNELAGDEAKQALMIFDPHTREPLFGTLLDKMKAGTPLAFPTHAKLINRQGIELDIEGSCEAIRDEGKQIRGMVLVLRDVTEAREWMRQQPDLWDRDPLTALPGLHYMESRLSKVLLNQRASDLPMTYIHVRIVGAERVYDASGQPAGDALVRHIASLLRSQVRDSDLIARMDAQDFGVLLTNCPLAVSARIERAIRDSLRHILFDWSGQTHTLTAKVGGIHTPPFSGPVDELLAAVALALE